MLLYFQRTILLLHMFHVNIQKCHISPEFFVKIMLYLPKQITKTVNVYKDTTPTAFILFLTLFYTSLSANSSIVFKFASLIVDLIVTTGSQIVISFIVSKIAVIFFAAIGAQLPFSIKATVRF